MYRTFAPLALLLALPLNTPLFAQSETPPPVPEATTTPAPNPFLHDETRADAEAKAAQMFGSMDLNHDGFVTVEEVSAYILARRPKTHGGVLPPVSALAKAMMADADTDKDGRVSAEESKAAADRGFDEVDTNHDGVISPVERMAANQEVMSDRKPRPEEKGR